MNIITSFLVIALLPFPKQYSTQIGNFHDTASIDKCIEVSFVQNIPEAGTHQEEAYRLKVKRKKIIIETTGHIGELRARQTLAQLLLDNPKKIKCCHICDWPAFPYRGFMQDCGRSFISTEELKTEIRTLSAMKINVFHWHLTENQAWRLESRIYPQLNSSENMTRFKGQYYRISEVREIIDLCNSLGMKVIPEIDMPGHSEAFKKCFGCSMQSWNGKKILKELVEEACETFKGCEYFHIGTDEANIYDPKFVPEMVDLLRSKGLKVISWNPGCEFKTGEIDIMQLWSSKGKAVPGIPAIDSRFHYLNHFDCFSDLRFLHSSKVYGQNEATEDIIGSEIAIWHDRYISDEKLMVIENSLYPAAAVLAERTWRGGEAGDFSDFEDRFIILKEKTMSGLPICYVRQNDMKWGITKAFPNEGDLSAVFPPEKEFPWMWAETYINGAGTYLRHVWGNICPQIFCNPQPNSTAYAWTYVWSPVDQKVGLYAEFQNYSRSEMDSPPEAGEWDRKGSKAWLNGKEILPPVWTEKSAPSDKEMELGNENMSSRDPLEVKLKKGWNYVLLKLPVGEFSTDDIRLVKWMFNFAFVTPDGKSAVQELKYDPRYLIQSYR